MKGSVALAVAGSIFARTPSLFGCPSLSLILAPAPLSIIGLPLRRQGPLPGGALADEACSRGRTLGVRLLNCGPFVVVDLKDVPDGQGLISEADFLTVGIAQDEFVQSHSREIVLSY